MGQGPPCCMSTLQVASDGHRRNRSDEVIVSQPGPSPGSQPTLLTSGLGVPAMAETKHSVHSQSSLECRCPEEPALPTSLYKQGSLARQFLKRAEDENLREHMQQAKSQEVAKEPMHPIVAHQTPHSEPMVQMQQVDAPPHDLMQEPQAPAPQLQKAHHAQCREPLTQVSQELGLHGAFLVASNPAQHPAKTQEVANEPMHHIAAHHTPPSEPMVHVQQLQEVHAPLHELVQEPQSPAQQLPKVHQAQCREPTTQVPPELGLHGVSLPAPNPAQHQPPSEPMAASLQPSYQTSSSSRFQVLPNTVPLALGVDRLDPGIVQQLVRSRQCVLVDVRGDDRTSGTIEGAIHVPAIDAVPFASKIPECVRQWRHQPLIVFHCQYSAHRAPQCANLYREQAPVHQRVAIMDGGFRGWESLGLLVQGAQGLGCHHHSNRYALQQGMQFAFQARTN